MVPSPPIIGVIASLFPSPLASAPQTTLTTSPTLYSLSRVLLRASPPPPTPPHPHKSKVQSSSPSVSAIPISAFVPISAPVGPSACSLKPATSYLVLAPPRVGTQPSSTAPQPAAPNRLRWPRLPGGSPDLSPTLLPQYNLPYLLPLSVALTPHEQQVYPPHPPPPHSGVPPRRSARLSPGAALTTAPPTTPALFSPTPSIRSLLSRPILCRHCVKLLQTHLLSHPIRPPHATSHTVSHLFPKHLLPPLSLANLVVQLSHPPLLLSLVWLSPLCPSLPL